MKRTDLQAIAETKINDAIYLFERGRTSNAYYLAGYAIEIGLKAVIARTMIAEAIPPKSLIDGIFNHDLKKLLNMAGLIGEQKKQADADVNFSANWAFVAQWTPECRYEITDQYNAQFLIEAITNTPSGVLPWIRKYW
jgi:HEPN domain-containing protein